MEYRNLGRTGVEVSALCLGCMMFGRKADEKQSIALVDKAIDSGINFLDTANVYQRGVSEEMLGEALKRNGKRDQIILATKVHGGMADDTQNAWGNSRRHIMEQCEASLKRLKTDYIDLYQIHRPQSAVPIDETLRALDDLIQAGKVRYIGTSTFAAWQVMESLWVSKEYRLNRFVTEQPPYHLLDRRIERELLPMAQSYGLGILPWSPLAGGFLSGRYREGQERPADSRFAERNEWNDRHFSDASFRVLDIVVTIAEEKQCTPSQIALAWCLRQPMVTSPIIGPHSLEQLEDNLGAVKVEFTKEDYKRLDEVAPPGRAVVSYYDADFAAPSHRW